MDEIAAATAVTKRSLYYHFESKDSLLASMLEAQHRLALAAFKTFGDRLSGSAESMIDAMFKDLAVWATNLVGLDRASRALSWNLPIFRATLPGPLLADTRPCSKAIWQTCWLQ